MAVIKNGEKICPRCGIILPSNAFGSDITTKDGLQVYCKSCKRELNHIQRQRRIEAGEEEIDMAKLMLVRKLLAMLKPYRTTKGMMTK